MSMPKTFNRQSHLNCVFKDNSKQLSAKQTPTGPPGSSHVKILLCHVTVQKVCKQSLCRTDLSSAIWLNILDVVLLSCL